MGKKLLIGITIILIAGLITGWYFFTLEAKYLGTSAFRAIPENASVIIRIHHLRNYTSKSLNNPIWKTCSGISGINGLYQKLSFADSLLNLFDKPKNLFIDKDLTLVFEGKENYFRSIFMIEMSSLAEKRALSDLLKKFFIRKSVSIEKVKSGGTDLFCYSWDEAGAHQSYYITFFRGLFLASYDREIVLQAVNQLNTSPTRSGSFFEKASKTATDNIDLNIYLNHQKLPQFAKQLFSETFWKRLIGSAPLAEWSEIDLTQKTDELLLNGFSFTGDSLRNYLEIFLHQRPDSFNLAGIFPAESTFFLSYVISDNARFFSDYEQLLDHHQGLEAYKKSINEINLLYGVDLQKMVADNLDGAAAMVFTRPDPVMEEENKYLVLRVGSGIKMENAMSPLITPVRSSKKRDLPKKYSLYKIDKETVFKIYPTPVNDFGKRIFGSVFSSVVTNFFTIYDNCLIMGASHESIGRFLRANVLQETLGNEQTYRKFTSGLSDRLNIFLWSSPDRSLPFFKEMLNPEIYQSIEKQHVVFQKLESAGWQIGIENGMTYNMARLKYSPAVHENPTSAIWKSHLGNRVIIRPQLMNNPSDKERREIVVQDSEYNFMLISAEGRIKWKIKLKSPVRSDVFQLNCFNDGKLQYFFSTDEALHMIGHEGKYVHNFPLVLHSAATNGVSVADYDRKRDYRFFIAGKDHKVYLYDKKGKMVAGWTPPRTEHTVFQPVQYFRVDNKAYIVFADKKRGYILDRKGKPVVNIKGDITYSHNRFTLQPKSGKRLARLISTDSKGNIVSIGFDGSVKKFPTGKFSPDHYFFYDDVDSDNQPDYLFLDGDSMVIYDQKINRIFARKFNRPICSPPELITFPDNSRKVGIADTIENKIWLFGMDGSSYKGFPLEGNSPFALGFFGNQNGAFNLITGAPDGSLYNYLIK